MQLRVSRGEEYRSRWLCHQVFMEQNSLLMLQAFNAIPPKSPFPSQSTLAHVTVLPKMGKDPQVCSSYHPRSLLNVDLKIYIEPLANRLNPQLLSLRHPDEVGFVSGKHAGSFPGRRKDIKYHGPLCHKPFNTLV